MLKSAVGFDPSPSFARSKDREDPLHSFRESFQFPQDPQNTDYLYFCGHSLGLQPKTATQAVETELERWRSSAVKGFFEGDQPWMDMHDRAAKDMAPLVGTRSGNIVVMNTLSVNIHLMLVSFYRPQGKRHKVLMEHSPFPSDLYAVKSQLRWHGLDPDESLITLSPRPGEDVIRPQDLDAELMAHADELALVYLGGINYYTGQLFDMQTISQRAHQLGAMVGFDLAHAAGNVDIDLDDTGADFAVWCTYKYLNGGPGNLGVCYINPRHYRSNEINRFEGWWGVRDDERFKMADDFRPYPHAGAWQLSNPPILSLAALMPALEIFNRAGMKAIRKKSVELTQYLEDLIDNSGVDQIQLITPKDPGQRGAMLSYKVLKGGKEVYDAIAAQGVLFDWREPGVFRVAPCPLYNSFEDVHKFVELLKRAISRS